MTARTAQMARIMAATYSDLQASDAFPQVTAPDDVTDAARFPNIAAAGEYLASLSPEQRALLEGDWA